MKFSKIKAFRQCFRVPKNTRKGVFENVMLEQRLCDYNVIFRDRILRSRPSRNITFLSFPRKEVIHAQLPLRMPCYDLVPIAGLAFGRPTTTFGHSQLS